MSLKDANEKEYFFSHLPRVMEGLATVTVERKILPKLCSALEFGAAPALAITPMLQAAKNLPIEVFEKKIIPTIVKLYDKTDRAIRVALLEHLQKYVHVMDEKMTDEIIYEKISTGFTVPASENELRLKSPFRASLHALGSAAGTCFS